MLELEISYRVVFVFPRCFLNFVCVCVCVFSLVFPVLVSIYVTKTLEHPDPGQNLGISYPKNRVYATNQIWNRTLKSTPKRLSTGQF